MVKINSRMSEKRCDILNDARVRGTAAAALLDRGWGKPKVEVVAKGNGYVEAHRQVALSVD